MDERNFRSTYYEKVGCRSVEEKKSLEILLKEKPINRSKLKQFCLRFTVPAVHRTILWNFLLGVYPVYIDNHEYVMAQRTAVYEDLLHALKIMQIVDDKTPKARAFHAMWLLENQKLYIGLNINADTTFVTITEIFLQIFDNDPEIYWIAKGFYEYTKEIDKECKGLIDSTIELLQKEDSTLYNHFKSINVLDVLPLQSWYTCCFAGIIAEPAIIRIWDKIIGGSKKILVFVSIVLFSTLRRQVLRCKDFKSLMQVIENIKEDPETADLLVNKAIELWQQNKGHSEFVVHRKDNN